MTTHHTVLWVSAHPEPRSLNGSLRRAGVEHLRKAGYDVVESDLYEMGWNPILSGEGVVPEGTHFHVTDDTRRAYIEGSLPADVAREQRKILAADALVIQFPLWWYGMPAILKGWFDRVFLSGFAFGKDPETGRRLRFENGPFADKRALVVTTLGDRAASIGARGKSGELAELLFGLLHGTFAYTGMDVLEPFALPSADFTEPESYRGHEQALLRRLDGLFVEPAIAYRPQFQGDYTDQWELVPSVRPGESGLSIHVREPRGEVPGTPECHNGRHRRVGLHEMDNLPLPLERLEVPSDDGISGEDSAECFDIAVADYLTAQGTAKGAADQA